MFTKISNKKFFVFLLLFLSFFITTNVNAATILSLNIETGGTLTVTGNASLGTVNGNTITTGTGILTLGAGKTLTISNTLTLAGTDNSTLNIGTGGTLGTAAYTASTAYQAVNTSLTSLAGLTYVSPSFVKMTGANTFALDTNTYLTSLSGAVLTDQTSGQTIGATGARLTKLWATDITLTNALVGSVTGNAGTVTNATLTTALTVNTGTVTLTGNVANTSVLTIGAGAVSVSGTNTGDNAANSSTMYIGTTAVALNRASAALVLTGITSIDGSSASTTGNAATATTATHLAGGLGGQIPYQTGAGTTAMLANGTAGQVLQSNGTTLAPSWGTVTSGANALGTYIVQTATNAPANAQILASLGTGIVKNTTTTGVLSIAVAGDFPTLNQNTTGSAATLTTPRAIYGNNFDGSAALTGIIASTYGGTGNGFTAFTGPTTAEKIFTLPDASATILTSNALITLAQGGTGANLTASNGGILYSTASASAILAGTATAGQILQSGASAAPTWSTATYPATAGTSGNVLTSNGTNFVSQAAKILTAVKTADEIVNNSDVYQDDDHLFVTLEASTSYILEFKGFLNHASSRLYFQFVAPSGATIKANGVSSYTGTNTATAGFGVKTVFNDFYSTPSSYSGQEFVYIDGVVTSGVGGLFKVQWKQVTAVAENLTMYAGSFMRLTKL